MVRAKDDWCDATFSNGKKLYYNEHYIDALSPDQTQFVLAHEAGCSIVGIWPVTLPLTRC